MNGRSINYQDRPADDGESHRGRIRVRECKWPNKRVLVGKAESGYVVTIKMLTKDRKVSRLDFGLSEEAAAALYMGLNWAFNLPDDKGAPQ